MIRFFRRSPANPDSCLDVDQLRMSRDSWRTLAERLGRRNEVLEQTKVRLQNEIAELNRQLRRARMVQMADHSTGRQS